MPSEEHRQTKFGGEIERYVAEKYEIIGELGSGAISKIYLAKISNKGKCQIEESIRSHVKNSMMKRIEAQIRGMIPDPEQAKEKLKHEEENIDAMANKVSFSEDYVAFKVTFRERTIATSDTQFEKELIKSHREMGIEREASLVVLPYHPNNVRIFDVGTTAKGHNYVAEEYVADTFPAEALSLDQAVEAVIQSGRGIQHLHKNRIVHRDIKPPNMLVQVRTERPGDLTRFQKQKAKIDTEYKKKKEELQMEYAMIGEKDEKKVAYISRKLYELKRNRIMETKKLAAIYGLKVKPGYGVKNCDFNIVKKLDPSPQDKVTKEPTVKGTVQFMAPESIGGGIYSERSDIYMLGASLYSVVTGDELYYGESHDDIMLQIAKNQRPVNPRKLNSHIDKDLTKIIAKCLNRNPNKRYNTVNDLIRDLTKWQSNRRYPRWKFWKKQKLEIADYGSVVYTNEIDPAKRGKRGIERVTQTLHIPRMWYTEAREKVAEIRSRPLKIMARTALYLTPLAIIAGLGLGLWLSWNYFKSSTEENQPKPKQEIQNKIET